MTNPLQDQDATVQPDSVSSAASLLQKAQERRQERETTLFLDVPTWNGDLIAEYKILGPEEMKAFATTAAANARNGAEPGTNDILLINAMCVCLHVLDRKDGSRIVVTDEFGPVNYGRIAKFLGKERVLKDSIDAVKYVMSERDKDDPDKWITNLVAINLHASAIQRWVRDTSKRTIDLEALLGEL